MDSEGQLFESASVEMEALASLEARIRKAAELVASLRTERDAALAELAAARQVAGPAVDEAKKLRAELATLRAERTEVRKRIEKLLGQMDALSSS